MRRAILTRLAVLAVSALAASACRDRTPQVVPAGETTRSGGDVALNSPATLTAGERLEYVVRYGPLSVGSAVMEVLGTTEVDGHTVMHTRLQITGGLPMFAVDDRYESWFDPATYSSHRFVQRIDEGDYERDRVFTIDPERRVFSESGGPEQPSVAEPLDEGSFIYFIRSLDLEVGRTYRFDRYFRPDRNPVTVEVLRREQITVPAGTFNTVVVRPTIRTRGIFAEGGRAELWFADDEAHVLVQLRSHLKFGSLTLSLSSIRRPR